MKIVYTAHLELRLRIRDIPLELPRRILKEAKDYYYDTLTKHYVAIHRLEFNGKLRDMVLIFDKKADWIEAITVHPIKPYQKQSLINSGRWKKDEQ